MERILLILILILLVLWVFNRPSTEAFDDFFNPVNNLINVANPPPVASKLLQLATQGVTTTNQNYLANTYEQPNPENPGSQTVQVGALAEQSPDFTIAQTICEPVTTIDCNAFDNPKFNTNCGISLDVENGYNSKGKPHIGGLYIDPAIKAAKNNTGIYQPTYGGSNLFAKDKATCKYMMDDINCKKHINPIGTKNCSMCFSDGSLHAVDPNTDPVNPTFVFYTNATQLGLIIEGPPETKIYMLISSNEKVDKNVVRDKTIISVNGLELTTVTITSVPIKEGQFFSIRAGNNDDNVAVAGYLQASTLSGQYKIDLNALIDTDMGQTPNMGGDVNGYLLFNQLDNITGPVRMSLRGLMTFTFKGIATHDSQNCTNGPFMTQKGSVDYIATNEPCYGPEATPGNYKMECLQQLFLASGGTQKGTGYPSTPDTAKTLLVDEKGTARTLNQIGQMLYSRMVTASTRLRNGESVSMEDWDAVSMFMTGVHKADPCDTRPGFPLSKECMVSLYNASGCFPMGKLNPAKNNPMNSDVATAMTKGNKARVSEIYRNTRQIAQNSGLSNLARQNAFQDCFGVPILQTAMRPALYVSVDGPYDNIQMSQLVVKDDKGVNVAKGGDTSLTTGGTYDKAGGNPSPNVAVDGTEATRPFPYVYASNNPNNPWFVVKLTKPSIISEIIYYGRNDCCPERNQKYIKIWDDNGNMWVSPRMTSENVQKFKIPMSVFEKVPKLAGRVTVSDYGFISMSQLVVKDKNGVNVARGGDTSQTNGGTYYGAGGNPAPSVAVDGTEAPRYFPNIYHSQRTDTGATFVVKLTKPSVISQIVFYGRLACCPERHQQTIRIYDSVTNQVLWKSPQMTQEVIQAFNIPASVFE